MGILGTQPGRARGLAVLATVAIALVPLPATAGETPPPSPLRQALSEARTRDVVSLPARPARSAPRRAGQSANPATESPAFFKTRTGIIVLGVMAGGVGYAIYSAQHDRIHSAGKQ